MTSDVNIAFDTERQAQADAAAQAQADWDARIASGKLVPIGGGQFRVNDPGSWDDGEVWTQRGGLIVPQHNLDMSSGQAALYSAHPEWHKLGNIIPGGTSDMEKVLELGGLNWMAEKRPVHFWTGIPSATDDDFAERVGGKLATMPGKYVNVRVTDEAPLGIVGERYTNVQNRDAFAFLQELTDDFGIIWESAGALHGGRRVFISVKLPEHMTIDAEGIADHVDCYIVYINSFDGSSPVMGLATPWRPRCGNTERFAVRDAWATWKVRHTASALNRVEEARRNLGLSLRFYKSFEKEETALARAAITMDKAQQVLEGIFPLVEDATDLQKRKHARLHEQLDERLATEVKAVGLTPYAVERTVTGWLDNEKPRRSGESQLAHLLRATANLEGNDDDVKSAAHKRLMTLVRK